MNEWVLDASALLAALRSEPGLERVRQAFASGAVMGAVNHAEVVTKLVDDGWTEDAARELLSVWSTDILPFDEATAYEAGLLRGATRHLGLSLGDRACLALARRLSASVLTADRAWAGLDVGVPVEVIR